MDTLISIIIIFGVLVAVHEWGHLYFAKRAGILCREFAIGFGPKLFSFKRGETVYTVRLLPLGGFVRMAGEDPETVTVKPGYEVGLVFNHRGQVNKIIVNNKAKHPEARLVSVERIDLEHRLILEAYEDEETGLQTYHIDPSCTLVVDEQPTQIAPWNRQFGAKTPGQKALTIFAGPAMNFVLAFLLLIVFFVINGIPSDKPVLGELTTEGMANEAGLHEGDEVLAINGEPVNSWTDMTSHIQEHPSETIEMKINRDGETMMVSLETDSRYNEVLEREEGFIGVYAPTEQSPVKAVQAASSEVYQVSMLIFDVFEMIITGEFSLDYLAGPVGIYNYTGEAADLGMLVLVRWAALLSINLGVVNLLPLPALDGGRLLFIGVEAIRGKPIDPEKEGMIHFIGFALLFLLMLVVTWNDINNFFL